MDNTGSYYYPAVQAQFDEAVDPATVNSQTVIVTDATGKAVKADVRYDAAIDQMQLAPARRAPGRQGLRRHHHHRRQGPARQSHGGQLQLDLHHLRRPPARRAAVPLSPGGQAVGSPAAHVPGTSCERKRSPTSPGHLGRLPYSSKNPPAPPRLSTAWIVSTSARADSALSSTATRAPGPCASFTKSMFERVLQRHVEGGHRTRSPGARQTSRPRPCRCPRSICC